MLNKAEAKKEKAHGNSEDLTSQKKVAEKKYGKIMCGYASL